MLRLIVKMERGEEEATWSTFDVTCPELEAMLGKAPLVIAGYEVRAGALVDRMKEMRERNEAAEKVRKEMLAKEQKERAEKEKAEPKPKKSNGQGRWFGMF